ncbi:MAG: VWA domain-containing protein [candidate division WOR-3 bacterium]
MIRFTNPEFLLLFLVLVGVYIIQPKIRQEPAFLYSSVLLLKGIIELPRPPGRAFLKFIRYTALCLIVVALARPQICVNPTLWRMDSPTTIIVLDISEDMNKPFYKDENMTLTGIEAIVYTTKRIIAKYGRGQVGIIGFGEKIRIFSPPTSNVDNLQSYLDRIRAFKDESPTALAEALTVAMSFLNSSNSKHIVCVVSFVPEDEKILNLLHQMKIMDLNLSFILMDTKAYVPQNPSTLEALQIEYVNSISTLERAFLKSLAGNIHNPIKNMATCEYEKELYHLVLVTALGLLLIEAFLSQTALRRLP